MPPPGHTRRPILAGRCSSPLIRRRNPLQWRPLMTATVERLPECKALLRAEVPAEDVAKERAQVVKAYAAQAKIPGFRPGKIPAKVIEKRYKESIDSELEERFVRAAVKHAHDNDGLRALGVTDVRDQNHTDDGGFHFTAELITEPTFELPEYKGIEVQVPDPTVTDEHLEKALEGIRERYADYSDIEGRGAEMGDFAVIDYKGSIGGQPVGEVAPQAPATLAQNTGFWLRMAEDTFMPGFCAALVGAEVGEERQVTVTAPEDIPDEQLRGQSIDYTVIIGGLKSQILPEFDDDFAAKVEEGKTMDALRETVRERIAADRDRQRQEWITNQVIDKLLAAAGDFEVPEHEVANETQSRVDDIVSNNSERGLSEDQILEHQEEIIQAAGQQAQMSVKSNYLLSKIAEAEEIAVENNEVLGAVAQIAARNNTPAKKLLKQLQKNDGLRRIYGQIRIQKTIAFLREHAQVTEVPVPETP